jgi:hypothetical protein
MENRVGCGGPSMTQAKYSTSWYNATGVRAPPSASFASEYPRVEPPSGEQLPVHPKYGLNTTTLIGLEPAAEMYVIRFANELEKYFTGLRLLRLCWFPAKRVKLVSHALALVCNGSLLVPKAILTDWLPKGTVAVVVTQS